MTNSHSPSSAESLDALAKTIWLAGFERAFSRTPTDPWENQAESAKAPHIFVARRIVESGLVTFHDAQAVGVRREVIHQAAKEGNLQYWRDAEKQRAAFDEWRLGGYVGDCPQLTKGTIVDYITDAIIAALASQPPAAPVDDGLYYADGAGGTFDQNDEPGARLSAEKDDLVAHLREQISALARHNKQLLKTPDQIAAQLRDGTEFAETPLSRSFAGNGEHLAEATRNVAAGLGLNWGDNWDASMRQEVIGHLLKVAKALDTLNEPQALSKTEADHG